MLSVAPILYSVLAPPPRTTKVEAFIGRNFDNNATHSNTPRKICQYGERNMIGSTLTW